MFNKLPIFVLAAVMSLSAQNNRLNQRSMMHITLPEDSPVAVLAADWGESMATPRGSAILLDLRTSLTLKNVASHRIRGVTLLVLAQEVAAGGKASVSVPSLDAGPGEAFQVRLNLNLLRPATSEKGPLVEISLDGVLFEDLSFYGPNRLNSRRSMTQWELEARRDRGYLKSMFERAGVEGVKQYLTDVSARLSERTKVDIQVARGRTTAQEPERTMKFAFLRMPGEPVQAVSGSAEVARSEAHSPQMEFHNTSSRPVKYLEVGWIVGDRNGESYFAGSVPAELNLAPGATGRIQQDATLKLSQRNGQSLPISSMTGFVSHVEFSDGKMWIPERADLEEMRLKKVLQPSPEEQRLSDLYRRKGIQAVVDELRKH